VGSRHFDSPGKREGWSVHVEAWQRSGLTQIKYCNIHGLKRGTIARWMNELADAKNRENAC
jgi:desulfoferrodoxin (superoxide reductase-like protein)